MDLTTITVTDFKNQFTRDFAYLPNWDPAQLYNTGNQVYYAPTLLFYKALIDGVPIGTTPDTLAPNWAQYVDSINNYVLDSDIINAFAEAMVVLNQGLYGPDSTIRMAYLYLTAHFLVNDLKTSAQGIASTGNYPVSARTVGSVSESYSIPEAYLEDPILSFYTKSGYGLKYLNMTLPNTVGNIGVVYGATQP